MGKIKIDESEFDQFFVYCHQLLTAGDAMLSELDGIGGMITHDMYKGQAFDNTVLYYQGLARNQQQLNSLYSKCFEYLRTVAHEMGKTDEDLSRMLQNYYAEEGGASNG